MNIRSISLLSCLVIAPCLSQAAPFQNGGFEQGVNIPGNYQTLLTGSTDITGWTISGRVDWCGSPWHPHSGTQSAQLVGNDSSLVQTFDTKIGQSYHVEFWVEDAYAVNTPYTVDATFGSDVYHAVYPLTPTTYVWRQYSHTFVATTTSTSLSITNVDRGYIGPFIDDVTVTAVPEPATLAVLGLGALFFRRKNRS